MKDASKKIKEEISSEKDSIKVYNCIKANIADTYIKIKKASKKTSDDISEIILSEFLIAGE